MGWFDRYIDERPPKRTVTVMMSNREYREKIREFREEYGERTSKVYKIRDWPSGTRGRGWGVLHDQVWFYDDPPAEAAMRLYDNVSWGSPNYPIWSIPDECSFWRLDLDSEERAWLRLYLDRKMIWLAGRTVRLHTFYCGDDEVPHDHPFDFVTIPFEMYEEYVWKYENSDKQGGWIVRENVVGSFMPHFRPAEYRHYVRHPPAPFSTIVFTGKRRRQWGFWPRPDFFVPASEWTSYGN